MMKNKFILLGIAVFLTTLSGCGDSKWGYVTGKVLIDGKPAEKGFIVHFQPQASGSSPSNGGTNDNGEYEMYFSISKKGVQAGLSKITVDYARGDGLPPAPKFLKAFNRNSSLVYEVKPGHQTYDINIDSTIVDTKSKK